MTACRCRAGGLIRGGKGVLGERRADNLGCLPLILSVRIMKVTPNWDPIRAQPQLSKVPPALPAFTILLFDQARLCVYVCVCTCYKSSTKVLILLAK